MTSEARGGARPPESGGGETILVVEDTRTARDIACKILERQGYRILQAENGEQALRRAEASTTAIDLLLTDVVMPGINGHELFHRLSAGRPGLRVLYMSGYADEVIAHHGVLEPGVAFVQKPFTVEGFTRKVRETLDAGPVPP